jgi:hypothetical protein
MKILVCGGRDFNDNFLLEKTLNEYLHLNPTIIEGGVQGADRMAGDWAEKNNIPYEVFFAEWKRFGKKAGLLRNQKMLDEGKADFVIAFPGGNGTADMIKRAKKANVPVKEIHYEKILQGFDP